MTGRVRTKSAFWTSPPPTKGAALWSMWCGEPPKVFVPLTVGGGVRTIDDYRQILRAGADKVSVNSAAIRNPELIRRAADKFGSQCVVVAVDAKRRADGGWGVFINGGRIDTGLDALDWVRRCEQLGAGEILLTSMDADGTKQGLTSR